MTADNRTNEPTDEQVEAAAKIIRRASLETTADPGDFWSDCYEEEREVWRNAARAALVAAQGAAPHVNSFGTSAERVKNGADSLHVEPRAESGCLCYGADGVTEPKCPTCLTAECDRDGMGICKRCGMGWDARKVLDGDVACPVLPSSTAPQAESDCWHEANCMCAPVLPSSGVDEDALARLLCEKNYLSPDGKPTCAACRDKAHEVAAWLKEQGGESRGDR